MYFRNYGVQKTWLHNCLKSMVSDDHLKSNMVNMPKHCWTTVKHLSDSTFTIFIDQ